MTLDKKIKEILVTDEQIYKAVSLVLTYVLKIMPSGEQVLIGLPREVRAIPKWYNSIQNDPIRYLNNPIGTYIECLNKLPD